MTQITKEQVQKIVEDAKNDFVKNILTLRNRYRFLGNKFEKDHSVTQEMAQIKTILASETKKGIEWIEYLTTKAEEFIKGENQDFVKDMEENFNQEQVTEETPTVAQETTSVEETPVSEQATEETPAVETTETTEASEADESVEAPVEETTEQQAQ